MNQSNEHFEGQSDDELRSILGCNGLPSKYKNLSQPPGRALSHMISKTHKPNDHETPIPQKPAATKTLTPKQLKP